MRTIPYNVSFVRRVDVICSVVPDPIRTWRAVTPFKSLSVSVRYCEIAMAWSLEVALVMGGILVKAVVKSFGVLVKLGVEFPIGQHSELNAEPVMSLSHCLFL